MTNEERERLMSLVRQHGEAHQPAAPVPTINGMKISCPNMGATILNALVDQDRPFTADEQQYVRAEIARQLQRQQG